MSRSTTARRGFLGALAGAAALGLVPAEAARRARVPAGTFLFRIEAAAIRNFRGFS
jgi:hypothetical protein